MISACHGLGIRFIIDVVMAFGTRAALENVNFDDFHIDPEHAERSDTSNRPGKARATASAVGSGATRALFPATTPSPAQAAISLRPDN